MNSLEDRLREALTERARRSPVHPDAWEQTLARTRRRPRSGAWGRYVIPAAAAAAVVAIVTAATVLTGHGGLDGGHRSSGASRTATAQPALPAPLSQKDYLIKQDPPVSQVVKVKAGTGKPAQWVYVWYARMKGGHGTVLCSEVRWGKFVAAAYCETVRLSVHQPGALTGGSGTVMVGASGGQVASVRAQVPGRPAVAGQLVSGRGFPARVWVVSLQEPDAATIVFRDAAGRQVGQLATLGAGLPPAGKPQHGGITMAHGTGFTWTAYLVDRRVSFWSGRWLLAYAGLPASGPPEVSVFFDIKDGVIPGPSGFYGYAHDDIAKVTVRLASGRLLTARTFPGWPGSGLRLWIAPVPSGLRQSPEYVALGYDSAGHLVWQGTHE